MLYIHSALLLDSAYQTDANSPLIGYHNAVTVTGLVSDTAEAAYPVTNLANPATHLFWRAASTAVQDVTADLSAYGGLVDYVAIASHNFASEQIEVSVEGSTNGTTFPHVLATGVIPADDGPLMFRFTAGVYLKVRVTFQTGTAAAQMAVLYAGKLLVGERRIYVGHTPITYGRKLRVTNGRSESGNFLGRIVTGEGRMSSVDFQNLTPTWYRSYLDPFFLAAQEAPFFWAWRPGKYPNEVGYAWLDGDPTVSNQRSNGMMQASFSMAGIA